MGGKIKPKTCPDNPNISLCGELFYGLEKYLAGNPGTYKYWEKVAENLEVDRLAYVVQHSDLDVSYSQSHCEPQMEVMST